MKYAGLRQCQKKFMYIPIDDTQNCPFCRLQLVVKKHLEIQLNELTYPNSIKVHKVVKPTNMKTLGTR